MDAPQSVSSPKLGSTITALMAIAIAELYFYYLVVVGVCLLACLTKLAAGSARRQAGAVGRQAGRRAGEQRRLTVIDKQNPCRLLLIFC